MARGRLVVRIGMPPEPKVSGTETKSNEEPVEDTRERVRLTDPDEIRRALAFLRSKDGAFFEDRRALNEVVQVKLAPPNRRFVETVIPTAFIPSNIIQLKTAFGV